MRKDDGADDAISWCHLSLFTSLHDDGTESDETCCCLITVTAVDAYRAGSWVDSALVRCCVASPHSFLKTPQKVLVPIVALIICWYYTKNSITEDRKRYNGFLELPDFGVAEGHIGRIGVIAGEDANFARSVGVVADTGGENAVNIKIDGVVASDDREFVGLAGFGFDGREIVEGDGRVVLIVFGNREIVSAVAADAKQVEF